MCIQNFIKKFPIAKVRLAVFLSLLFSFCFFYTNAKDSDISGIKAKESEWLSSKNEKGFLENCGQMADVQGNPVSFVLFKTESNGFNFWITETGFTLQTLNWKEEEAISENERTQPEEQYLAWERIDVELKGANIKKENVVKEKAVQGYFNYFYPHCSDGIYKVKEYEKITIKEIYSGIDWVFYRKQDGTLKYDFVVHPGADYKQLELLYKSKSPIKINEHGELEQYTSCGNLKENTPISFYNGETITTQFKLKTQRPININGDSGYETSITFNLTLPLITGNGILVIDPQLSWATFYGGNGLDGPMSVGTDTSGNVFVAGYSGSANFPTKDAGTFFQGLNAGNPDVFILKFDYAGNPQWATFYGGGQGDWGNSMAVDAFGNVLVTGFTASTNFPIQNAFQPAHGTGFYDAFIVKFDNSGVRQWATYYGGSDRDLGYSVVTDAAGSVFVAGSTGSLDFPTNNSGTFFQIAKAGPATGSDKWDAFVSKFDNSGSLLWATYYGGSKSDEAFSIACDVSGNVFVTGEARSVDFFTKNAFQGGMPVADYSAEEIYLF